MPAAAVATLAIVAVLVAALAFYLLWIALVLRRVDGTLGRVTSEVRGMAQRTTDLNGVMADVNADLESVASALEDLGGRFGAEHSDARAS